jgi:hypothetical protein
VENRNTVTCLRKRLAEAINPMLCPGKYEDGSSLHRQ